ncbi:thioredoxin family protein, partial [Pseudomonas aeruginosa]|uniref:thioredoxin family protein n=1 Tax=Pseudomonas aeruginosa TaxID=287 RepID=UPI00359C89F3
RIERRYRLLVAGEMWCPDCQINLAAILTDLAWLLRAYSQSVSSDGAQHGEKTS